LLPGSCPAKIGKDTIGCIKAVLGQFRCGFSGDLFLGFKAKPPGINLGGSLNIFGFFNS
jgi:hypothetical protein